MGYNLIKTCRFMKYLVSTMAGFLFLLVRADAQSPVIAGPMLGPVEFRDAKVWIEVAPSVQSVSLSYGKKGQPLSGTVLYKGELGRSFNPLQFTIGGLEYNTVYEYRFVIDGQPSAARGEFTTKELWQFRKGPPDFSFVTGSCSFFNDPRYDRPGIPAGQDSSIFISMAKENARFMLWLGDEWYTREVDYNSEWGLWYRAQHDRAMPVMQPFWKSMTQIAIWDDHDYGPNDIGTNYILKNTSREIWKNYWCNPSYGEDGKGIYTMYSWGDVDLFLTDDRWWRSADEFSDSVNGKPNPEKRMFGKQQMDWLKNSLVYSQATFKIIVSGSQVLNTVSPYDKLLDFPVEFEELLHFIGENNIDGVLFLSGDRHHSEIIKRERPGTYPLFDITVSPLTSPTHRFSGAEVNNPYRVFGLDRKQNYGRVSVSGAYGNRKLQVEYLGVKGEKLGEWGIDEKSLKSPGKKTP